MKKFKVGDDVEILGTDGVVGYIPGLDVSNSDMYVVALDAQDIQAVYPYQGYTRLYPEHMLTLVE